MRAMLGVTILWGVVGCAAAPPPPAVHVMPEAVVVAEPASPPAVDEAPVEVPPIEPTPVVAAEPTPAEQPLAPEPEDESPDPDVGSRDPFNSDVVDANVEGRFIIDHALKTPAPSRGKGR